MDDDTPSSIPQFVFEYLSAEAAQYIQSELDAGTGPVLFLRLMGAVARSVPDEYRTQTRVVISGNFVQSVNDRRAVGGEAYTIDRGSGIVAGKTMGKQADGVVDILFPEAWAASLPTEELIALVTHLGAHEATHATLDHIGGEPFWIHKREEFGPASLQFASMAGSQVEEHLAEYLANQERRDWTGTGRANAEQTKQAFDAWKRTLAEELPALNRFAPGYFEKGMLVSLNALDVLWKTLAYLAAEIRDGDSFGPVPPDVVALPEWQQEVAPYWDEYLELLAEVPMTTSVNIPATDEVVKRLTLFLQRWALNVGFDYHDTDRGGWFQITRKGIPGA